jgi:phosphoribosylanthranilate isomerase
MTRVKICGITNLEDALVAVDAGADALGFVFFRESPRHIFPEEAARIIALLPPFVQTVGLFVNQDNAAISDVADLCRLDLIQLHGDETPEQCHQLKRRVLKAFRIKSMTCLDPMVNYQTSGFLLDAYSPSAYGGTGMTFNWEIASEAVKRHNRIILAGGLVPENVAEAIQNVKPYAVDVSSGVELSPGRKDHQKVRAFIRNAKEALP